jgi:hypothetical protein
MTEDTTVETDTDEEHYVRTVSHQAAIDLIAQNIRDGRRVLFGLNEPRILGALDRLKGWTGYLDDGIDEVVNGTSECSCFQIASTMLYFSDPWAGNVLIITIPMDTVLDEFLAALGITTPPQASHRYVGLGFEGHMATMVSEAIRLADPEMTEWLIKAGMPESTEIVPENAPVPEGSGTAE